MARMARATRKRLGEILMDQGVVEANQIVEALQEQKRTGELLGETLVRMNYATEDDVARCIVLQFGLPFISVKKYRISEEMTTIFPPRLLAQYMFVPIDRMGAVIAVVAGTLLTPDILSELEQLSGYRIQVFVGKQSEIRELLQSQFAPREVVEEPPEEQKLTGLGSMFLSDG